MTRDLTQRQFDAALARNGFGNPKYLGYVDVGGGCLVSVLNAGPRRRDQLAYLIRSSRKLQSKPQGAQ